MADDDKNTDDKDDKKPEGDTLTQADVDRIVNERLKRERAKYADYDDLKAKVTAAEQAKQKDKSEAQQLTEKLDQMQKALDDERRQRWIVEVAGEKGLTPAHVKRLSGSSREELEASADELLEDFPISAKSEDGSGDGDDKKKGPSGKPREQLKPGNNDPDEPVEETDLKKLGERMFSR